MEEEKEEDLAVMETEQERIACLRESIVCIYMHSYNTEREREREKFSETEI